MCFFKTSSNFFLICKDSIICQILFPLVLNFLSHYMMMFSSMLLLLLLVLESLMIRSSSPLNVQDYQIAYAALNVMIFKVYTQIAK